jgi:hypothetical protein
VDERVQRGATDLSGTANAMTQRSVAAESTESDEAAAEHGSNTPSDSDTERGGEADPETETETEAEAEAAEIEGAARTAAPRG